MPSTNVFDRQDQAYKDSVLTPGVKRVAIEAGITEIFRAEFYQPSFMCAGMPGRNAAANCSRGGESFGETNESEQLPRVAGPQGWHDALVHR
jgi:transketolase